MAPENRRYSPKESSPPTVYKMVHTFSPQNGDFSGETFLAMGDLLCEGRYIMVEALICSQQLQKAPLKTENSCHSYVCLTRLDAGDVERVESGMVWKCGEKNLNVMLNFGGVTYQESVDF